MTVPWSAMTKMELGREKWSARRTAIGAGTGLLAGSAFGALLGATLARDQNAIAGATVFGVWAFGSIGLILGTAIGATPHEQWQATPLDSGSSLRARAGSVPNSGGNWSGGLSVGFAQSPSYDLASSTEARRGFHLGMGLVKHHAVGPFSLGVRVRWPAIPFMSPSGAVVPSFFMISTGIALG